MAITNAQQFKQLQLVKSRKDGKRPGYYGADAGFGDDNYKDASADFDAGSGSGGSDADFARARSAIADRQAAEQARIEKERFEKEKRNLEINQKQRLKQKQNFAEKFRIISLKNLYDQKTGLKSAIPSFGNILSTFDPALNVYERSNPAVDQYGMSGKDLTDVDRLADAINKGESTGDISQTEFEEAFYGPEGPRQLGSSNDTSDPFIPIIPKIIADKTGIMNQEPEIEEDEGLSRRFRADGGIMNTDVVGGEMDFESARQMYGLGKLVKKVTRSVKKIAKSPIGKAALIGVAGFGIPGTTFGGLFGRASFGNAARGLLGQEGIKATLFGLPSGNLTAPITKGLIGEGGKLALGSGKLGIGTLIAGTSLLAGALTKEQEEEAQLISDETGIDIAEIRANPNKYLGRRFRAEGGSMDEPVAKKTMPLLDMGGKEMDLRAEGGFVPIGRMEKADDVPARLSKNEFVFTAEAVRNAGEGDVDKGAEVMYNMMKNLESGGEVSEESQGLEGARKMFQTSQRLEEVL
jgi:hypothetical protein